MALAFSWSERRLTKSSARACADSFTLQNGNPLHGLERHPFGQDTELGSGSGGGAGEGFGTGVDVAPRHNPALGPLRATRRWPSVSPSLTKVHFDAGEPLHHHMPTLPVVHQSPPISPGTLENKQASPEAFRGEPAREILVRNVPSAPSRHVAEVIGLLPQYAGMNVVSHDITRTSHPGKPPAASKQKPL